MKSLALLFSLLLPVSASLAGEGLSLDKDFSFRLGDSLAKPVTTDSLSEKQAQPDPLKMPDGTAMPPGTKARKFNGQPVYFIPLGA